MKVIQDIKNNSCAIKSVPVGECFIYNNRLHIKVDWFYNKVNENYAVNIETGKLNILIDSIIVELVNAEVTYSTTVQHK